MHIRTVLLVLMGILTSAAMQARHLTPDEALSRAMNQIPASTNIQLAPADINLSTELVYSADFNHKSMAYVFKSEGHGFLVVSADDVAVPLLGYSDDTDFDPENIPVNFKAWLDGYAQQISYAANDASFAGMSTAANIERTERPAVAPKLTTTWNQNAPYWNDCPILNGDRCYTGCVATALSQIMNYHKWPEKGQGSISYHWTSGDHTLSCNFSDMTFEWDKMLDSYTANSPTENCDAVALLMKACGYATKMNYSLEGSGSTIDHTAEGLIKYFDYDQSICIQKREWYDAQEWEDLMYTELTTNGPVFHTGASYSGGHAFVCDGYISNGYFHFNWGWGGMSDGYFLLSALNPGSHGIGGNNSGFNMNQMILQNLTRSKENSLPTAIMYSSGGFTTSTTSTTVGSKVSFIPVVASYGFENYSILPIHDVTIGIKCVNSTNNDSTYISAITCPTLQPNEYFDSISVILPSTLKDGSYIVSPVYRAGSGEWTDMKTNALYNNAIIMTVNGSSITFANKGADIKIEATDITFLSEISPLYHFYIQATYTNVGKQEFEGYIQARFLDESGKAVAAAEAFSLKLNPQQQAIITYMSHIVQGSLSGGNYYLAFYSVSQREYINEPIPITVVEEPALTCSKITMGNQNSVNCNDVRVRATIICSASEYTGPIAFLVFNENNMYFPISWFHSEPQYLTAGKTQNVVVTGTFPKGQVGQSYIGQMAFWGKDEQLHRIESTTIRFKVSEASGIDDIMTDGTLTAPVIYPNPAESLATLESPVDIMHVETYSLSGAMVKTVTDINGKRATLNVSALPAGTYIVVTTGTDSIRRTAKLIKR